MPHFYSVWNICMWLHSLSKNANEFCLLATELANTKWESLCQLFADVFDLLLIHLQDVPPVRNSGMEHSFMRFVFFFFFFPLFFPPISWSSYSHHFLLYLPEICHRCFCFCPQSYWLTVSLNFMWISRLFYFTLGLRNAHCNSCTAVYSCLQQEWCTAGTACNYLTSLCWQFHFLIRGQFLQDIFKQHKLKH